MISRNAWPLVVLVVIVVAAIVAFFAVRQPQPAREGEQATEQEALCFVYWTGAQELQSWETLLRTAHTLRNRLWESTAGRWLEPDFRQELESMVAFQLVLLGSLDQGIQQFCSSSGGV